MSVAVETVALTFLNIVANVPANNNFPLYEEDEVEVLYGKNSLKAILNTDFEVTLSPPKYNSFQITPKASLITKINNLIAIDGTEINYMTVRRKLPLTTSVEQETVRYTPYLKREIERMWLALQQQAEEGFRTIKLAPKVAGEPDVAYYIEEPLADAIIMWNDDGTALINGPSVVEIETDKDAAEAAAAAAAVSEANAASSEANADADATQTLADRLATAADRVQTGLDRVAVAADKVTVAADKATVAADKALVHADMLAADADATQTAADRVQTGLDRIATAADVVSANAALANVLSAYDSFDDRYLGAKAADPALDNDGNALVAGAIYYKTTATPGMRIWTGAIWDYAYVPGGSYLVIGNNLSDLGNVVTARTNLGLGALAVKSTIATADVDALAITEPKLATAVFSALTNTSPATGDHLAGADVSAAGTKVKFLVSGILDLLRNAATNTLTGTALTLSNATSPIIQTVDTTASVTTGITSTDTTGYAGTVSNHPFAIMTNNSGRILVDAAGRVTMPSQPMFSAYRDAGNITTSGDIIYNGEKFDVGSNFNTTTGFFTAPVTGTYEFDVYHQTNGTTSSNAYIRMNKNGAVYRLFECNANTLGSVFGTVKMQLTAGDTVNCVLIIVFSTMLLYTGSEAYNGFEGKLIA